MNWLVDEFRRIFDDGELILTDADKLITKEVDAVITDALAAIKNAVEQAVAERTSDRAALAQAQTDRDAFKSQLDAANAQLADAETQINALVAQLNPPAQ